MNYFSVYPHQYAAFQGFFAARGVTLTLHLKFGDLRYVTFTLHLKFGDLLCAFLLIVPWIPGLAISLC